jgi:hypothetical protein
MNFVITDLLDTILTFACLGALLYFIYLVLSSNLFKQKEECINGVKLGNIFKLICEIDESVRLYLDTGTKIMYLVSEDGITPVLDAKGKPRKYTEFIESIRGKE